VYERCERKRPIKSSKGDFSKEAIDVVSLQYTNADHVERVPRNPPHQNRVACPNPDFGVECVTTQKFTQKLAMSSSAHHRAASASERKPSATQSRRATTSATEPRKQTSNSPEAGRRPTSGATEESSRPNSTMDESRRQNSATERRTERTTRTTRETITVRTKSPLKPISDSRVNGRRSRDVDGDATPKNLKEAESAPGTCFPTPRRLGNQMLNV
jgi:hypothetical protein